MTLFTRETSEAVTSIKGRRSHPDEKDILQYTETLIARVHIREGRVPRPDEGIQIRRMLHEEVFLGEREDASGERDPPRVGGPGGG